MKINGYPRLSFTTRTPQQADPRDPIGMIKAQRYLQEMIKKDNAPGTMIKQIKSSLTLTTKSVVGQPHNESDHVFGAVVSNLSTRFEDRIQCQNSEIYPAASFLGNNYIFHHANASPTTTVMDSTYIKPKRDGSVVVAVADGAGHPYDEISTQNILKVSRNATEYSARLLAKYNTADEIIRNIQGIVRVMDDFLRDLTDGQEQTTLAAARVFPTKNGYRVVGFSVGDSEIGFISPDTGTLNPLTHSGRIGNVTYQLGRWPNGDVEMEHIGVIRANIPANAVLYLATDGVSDALNFNQGGFQIIPTSDPAEIRNEILRSLNVHFDDTVLQFNQLNTQREAAQRLYSEALKLSGSDAEARKIAALMGLKNMDAAIQNLQATSGCDDLCFTVLSLPPVK